MKEVSGRRRSSEGPRTIIGGQPWLKRKMVSSAFVKTTSVHSLRQHATAERPEAAVVLVGIAVTATRHPSVVLGTTEVPPRQPHRSPLARLFPAIDKPLTVN